MKFYRLTIFASLFLTAVMLLLIFVFNTAKHTFSTSDQRFFLTVILSSILMAIINYLVLDALFNYYGKKQIRKISTILPEEIINEDSTLNFTELGKRVSDLNLKNTTEIDTMKEMEIYRKEYIGNVSHEMKTPLFTIQGYVDTLLEGGVENLAIRDKYLNRIEKSVERLLTIVQDLDMINQFESGAISLNTTKFDLNQLVRDMIDLLDLEAQKKGTRILLRSQAVHMNVIADQQKISQVLMNLLSNAINYSNREKARVIVRTSVSNDKVLVVIADNGMGIKPEMLPRIFERFFRVESSRSRNEGGSGLGLAIVKHILEAHRENISVESTYLEGATFSFSLQRAF